MKIKYQGLSGVPDIFGKAMYYMKENGYDFRETTAFCGVKIASNQQPKK